MPGLNLANVTTPVYDTTAPKFGTACFSMTATTLTAAATAATTLSVASSTGFSVGDSIDVGPAGSTPTVTVIQTIPNGTSITVSPAVTSANGGAVRKGRVFGSPQLPDLPYTMTAWVKRSSTGGAVGRVAVGKQNSIWIGTIGDNAASDLGNQTSGQIRTTVNVSDGNWHHLALVVQTTGTTLYVDGTLAGSSTGNATNTNYLAFNAGGTNDAERQWGVGAFGGGASPFDGFVDDVAIWNGALYSANFTPPASATSPSATNLIALYNFDSNTNNSATTRTSFTPDNAAILYSPDNWVTSGTESQTRYPGAYFRLIFTGTSIDLNFNTSALTGQFPKISWKLDEGGFSNPAPITSSFRINVSDASNVQKSHSLEVRLIAVDQTVDAWNGNNNSLRLTSVAVDTGRTISAPIRRTGNIAMFGDSVITGIYANNGGFGTPGTGISSSVIDRSDVSQSYGFKLCEQSGREFCVLGLPGTGVVNPTTPSSIPFYPNLTNNYNLQYAGVTRTWGSNTYEAVIIAHGRNDSGAGTDPTAFTAILNTLLATPGMTTAKFFVILPVTGERVVNWTTAASNCNDPSRVQVVQTSGMFTSTQSPDGVHPYGWQHNATIFPALQPTFRAFLAPAATVQRKSYFQF